MTTLRDELLRFVNRLRGAGVRISIAETLDAMNAIAAAGLGAPMREALACQSSRTKTIGTASTSCSRFFASARNQVTTAGESREPNHRRRRERVASSESIRSVRKDKKPSSSAVATKNEPREETETESEQLSEEPAMRRKPKRILREKDRASRKREAADEQREGCLKQPGYQTA